MKASGLLSFFSILLVFGLARIVYAGAVEESFAEQFLGSPLLALVAILVIAVVASLYYKMRK